MKFITLQMLLLTAACTANAASILGIMTLPSKSHNIWNTKLMRTLATRGHKVTILTAFEEKNLGPNYTQYVLKQLAYPEMGTLELFITSPITSIDMYTEINQDMCSEMLTGDSFRNIINSVKSTTFDLIIADVTGLECLLGVVHVLGSPPVIAVTAYNHPIWYSYMTGNPHNPAYVPEFASGFSDHMTFSQRLMNTVYHAYSVYTYEWSYLPKLDAIAREYFGGDMPHIRDIRNNVSLVMVNTHAGFDHPRPLLPSVVEVGGLHVGQTQPLPQNLKKPMDEAKDGFIYFSLGSVLRSDKLPPERRQVFLEAFSRLPYRVFWKWESDSLPGQPSNVIVGKWMPQRDILAHPNILLFITHNGLLSTQEAVYNGVPIIGVPFFADQLDNSVKSKSCGFAESIDFVTVTADHLVETIQKIISNKRYKDNARRLSQLMRDQPQTPLERAVFWTEYVIRHKGAPHLRSAAADMPWYQYLLLDVVCVLATGVFLVLLLFYKTFCVVLSLFKSPRKQEKQKKH